MPASPTAPPATTPRKNKRRSKGRTKTQKRARYRTETPQPERWIANLRLQVAARSSRLARCFEGTDRPGALRWTAAVDLTSGTVSDHKLVPSLAGIVLTEDLRSCLLQVLSAPAYRLSRATTEAPAPQISIVIEF